MYLFANDVDQTTINHIKHVNEDIIDQVSEINANPNKSALIKSRKFLAGGTLESNNCFIVTDNVPPNNKKEMLDKWMVILPMSAWEDIDVPIVERVAVVLQPYLLIWWQSLESIQAVN
jgi:hypothetical protein